jgi:uncharacterized protein YndB with AHSA1/START domain
MIDVDEQIRAVARAVEGRTVDGRPANVVVLAQTYPTDAADLWDAVTSAARLPRWFAPVTGELREGGRYQVEGNAGGTVTRCDEPNGFDATWEWEGGVSWIEVRFTAVDEEHTRLELTHIAHPDDHWDQYGPGAVGIGWDLSLLGMAMYLDSPDGERPPEADAFPGTPEGLRFMTASGEGWIAADVAGGADPDQARRMGETTIAAYTTPG